MLELAPSEYWRMTPTEVNRYIEARRPKQRFGNIGEREADSMAEARERLLANGIEIL